MARNVALKVKKRRSRTKEAVRKQVDRKEKKWEDTLLKFESFADGLCNERGRSRTLEENKLLLLALKAALKRRVESKERTYPGVRLMKRYAGTSVLVKSISQR